MAGAFKQCTYLTGLDVCKNPRSILLRIYSRTSKLLLKMPEQFAYRKNTQEIIARRSAIINSADSIKAMEDKIGCGQIEEVIQQARRELELAQLFIVYRPWEKLVATPPKNQWKWPVN